MKNKVLKISIAIGILILAIFTYAKFNKTIDATATNEMVSTTQGKPSQFPYITYNDLIERYDILCSQYGAPLPGYEATVVSSNGKTSSQAYLTKNDIGKRLFEEKSSSTSSTFTNPYSLANNLTYGYYTASDTRPTSFEESYILSEMSENVYSSKTDFYNVTSTEYTGEVTLDFVVTAYGKTLYGVEINNNTPTKYVVKGDDGKYYYVELKESESFFPYTYVQYAWWSTEAGGSSNVASTALLREAEAFSAYIEKVAKKDNSGKVITENKTVTINGKTVTVNAPVIDYKVVYHKEDAKVNYDETQKRYLVGPFSIDYYEDAVTSTRGKIEFAGITSSKLVGNLGEVDKKEWKLVFPDRAENDNSEYPHNGEKFYLSLNYIEGMTEITDFGFDFRYMNAAGEYSKLNGTYFKATWEPKSEAVWCSEPTSYCACGGTFEGRHGPIYDDYGNIIGYRCNGGAKKCSHGYYHSHIIEWNYWLELTELEEQNSQTLIQAILGARWYDTKSITFDTVIEGPKEAIKLTIPVAGNVWIDTKTDKKNPTTDGLKEGNEVPYEKAEVYVYKVFSDSNGKEIKRELAKIYDNDNKTELSFPIYTDAEGKYSIPNMPVPGTDDKDYKDYIITYDVVFKYDGQNYEASTFLPTSDGDASQYINANKEEKVKYENDSMAVENNSERENFNKKFEEIYGEKAIDENGNTIGKTSGNLSLNYTSTDFTVPGDTTTKKKSTLQTKDSDGYTVEQYKMTASTKNAGLDYPFDRKISIDTADDVETISIEKDGNLTTTTYKAIYNYILHINLGLKERTKADIGVTKDLFKAEIVVNEKDITEKYNVAYDLEKPENKDLLETQIEAAKTKKYTLGLYSSDYAYRSNVYRTSADVVKQIKSGTELRVFATYRIAIFNESDGLDIKVNELADYYDSSFTPVNEDVNVSVLDENENRITKKVAESSYYRIIPASEVPNYNDTTTGSKKLSWGTNQSINNDYIKMTTSDLSDIKLAAGDRLELFVTYEVNKDYDKNSSQRPELLGEKNNIAEISNYSTYNTDGTIAGRVDKDSAPNNINLNKNQKDWYEDDTESAPILNITLNSYSRELNGIVWEDIETEKIAYDQMVGNGKYDENTEKGIPNIDVELVEKINIDGIEYEYIWPEEAFKGTDAEGLYKSQTKTGEDGKYTIKGFVAGNYVVRFKYGNSEENIKYNGQDYKNTAYQAGIQNADGTTTLNNEWHDLLDKNLNESHVSDARDYELQRMKVVAYSKNINNKNGEILETADNTSLKHDELIKNTQMVANTAKINVEIEHQQYIDYGTVKTVDGVNNYTYVVNDIDFGLEKRSETVLELDKKLVGITLKKLDDSTPIMKVVINSDGTIDTEKSNNLDKLLRQTPVGNEQGFSYVIMEEGYLNNLTVELDYKITVSNKSEVDWTGELADFNTSEEILAEVNKLETQPDYVSGSAIEYGKYVGMNYYTNQNYDTDKIVTTKVEKIVDYVDNNIGTNLENNSNIENKSWKTISVDELKSQGLLSDKVYTNVDGKSQIIDDKGIAYQSNIKNNILISDEQSYNPSLIAELVPQTVTNSKLNSTGDIYITTLKTVSSGIDADDMLFNNVSEILQYTNTVGRRDTQSVPGNAEISRGEYEAASGYSVSGQLVEDYEGAKEVTVNGKIAHLNGERDTSASEFVTFTEPTGIRVEQETAQNYMIYVLLAFTVLAGGIILIKKTIIK